MDESFLPVVHLCPKRPRTHVYSSTKVGKHLWLLLLSSDGYQSVKNCSEVAGVTSRTTRSPGFLSGHLIDTSLSEVISRTAPFSPPVGQYGNGTLTLSMLGGPTL